MFLYHIRTMSEGLDMTTTKWKLFERCENSDRRHPSYVDCSNRTYLVIGRKLLSNPSS